MPLNFTKYKINTEYQHIILAKVAFAQQSALKCFEIKDSKKEKQ